MNTGIKLKNELWKNLYNIFLCQLEKARLSSFVQVVGSKYKNRCSKLFASIHSRTSIVVSPVLVECYNFLLETSEISHMIFTSINDLF